MEFLNRGMNREQNGSPRSLESAKVSLGNLNILGTAERSQQFMECGPKNTSSDEPLDASYCSLPIVNPELNQWIQITPLEKMIEIEYDVLIVGSGAGGGAVLWRLADQWGNNGKKIGVVEAGDLFLPTHAMNLPTINYQQNSSLVTNKFGFYGEELPELPGAMSKIVFGGATLFWSNLTPRMANSELLRWPISLQEMNYYYSAAEAIMNVNTNISKGSPISEIMLGRLRQHGYYKATHRPMSLNLEPTQYGVTNSNVFFSSIIFFAYAMNRRPVDLSVNTRAVKVLTDHGRIVGIEVVSQDKKSHRIRAKKVVLSASTLETPRILLHSGVTGRSIGHYLTDHGAVIAQGTVGRGVFPEVLGALSIVVPEEEGTPFQVDIRRNDKYYLYKYDMQPVLKEIPINFHAYCKLESHFDNYLTLDPDRKDEYGVPKIRVHFSYSETDQRVIRQTIAGVKNVVNATGVSLTSEVCRHVPGRERHYVGTCRIGQDSSTAAANPYGEIFGVSGLFIADNSMLPSMSAANPTLTTIALSIRTADHIIRQFQNND
ncbi:glucose-methanol-choline oxidoreductase (plasmid) [Paenibacillus polymyxa M1]|uniref:GMC oxidoreductase n=1 Tax=Paenibacillus polymyxa TaxID=1406 RepID=UPI00021BBB0E|nr:GMC oxidoreductase [Paenibacillus polymyxa]CCC86184.1 glucose-methanol-choline oxidoreductase [Paenibacillus polymyxa M1]